MTGPMQGTRPVPGAAPRPVPRPMPHAVPSAVRVVLADDHAIVRRGLAALLRATGGYDVVAEAGDGEAAVEAVAAHDPDLVLLDLSMPRANGLDALRRLAPRFARGRAAGRGPLRVLVLSMYGEEQFAAQALDAGASGYLLKHAMDDELFRAIDAVLAGREYVSGAIAAERVRALRAGADRELGQALTAREREVLRLILAGGNTAAVAQALGISPHTAVRHRANLMRKLGAHNRVELLRRAAELALVVPGG